MALLTGVFWSRRTARLLQQLEKANWSCSYQVGQGLSDEHSSDSCLITFLQLNKEGRGLKGAKCSVVICLQLVSTGHCLSKHSPQGNWQ